jgi:hypothetical protein
LGWQTDPLWENESLGMTSDGLTDGAPLRIQSVANIKKKEEVRT